MASEQISSRNLGAPGLLPRKVLFTFAAIMRADRFPNANKRNHFGFSVNYDTDREGRFYIRAYLTKSSRFSTCRDTISSVFGSNFGIWARVSTHWVTADWIMENTRSIANWTVVFFSMRTIVTRLKGSWKRELRSEHFISLVQICLHSDSPLKTSASKSWPCPIKTQAGHTLAESCWRPTLRWGHPHINPRCDVVGGIQKSLYGRILNDVVEKFQLK